MKNIINTFWCQGVIDFMSKICIESWLNLGYEVHLWTYNPLEMKNSISFNVEIKDAKTICPFMENEDYAPMSDIFRFTLAKKYNYEKKHYIWADSDLFLIRRFPTKNIISSEHTKKVGAFKSIKDNVPNIGFLQFLPETPYIKTIDFDKILTKIEKNSNQNSNKNSYMKIFQKEVKSNDKIDYIAEPNAFCPISWANYKDLYISMNCKSKFGMNVIENFYEFWNNSNVYGIHLWRNLYNINKPNISTSSLFSLLPTIPSTEIKFYIPTYKRPIILNKTTIPFLNQSFILKEKIYLVVDIDDNSYDAIDHNILKCPVEGIGQVRSWILNEVAYGGDILVMIDDDIQYLINKDGKKTYLNEVLNEQINIMKIRGAYLSGFPLCSNIFYLKESYTTNLTYISGAIQIHRINSEMVNIETTLRHFEDYHFNIQYFLRDGLILRNNSIAPITDNYNEKGGICEQYGGLQKRLKDAEKVARELVEEYPDMCYSYFKNASSRVPASWNLRLNHNFRYGE